MENENSQVQLPEVDALNKKTETKEKIIYGAGCAYELTKWLTVALIFVSLIHFFVVTPFIVNGISMEPNFFTGEYVLANRWQYLFGKPQRGDVVILKFPGDPEHKKYIKRVIGLPGENVIIQDGFVFVNGQRLSEPYLPSDTVTYPNVNRTLKEDDFFLLGDNRANSNDSRVWGVANKQYLIGSAWLIFYPFNKFGIINQTYPILGDKIIGT